MNVGTGSFVTEWFAGLKLSKFEVHLSPVKLPPSSMPDISLQYDITTPTKQWSPNKFGLRAVSSPLNAPNIIQCASSLLLAFCVRSFYPSNLHLNHMRLACGASHTWEPIGAQKQNYQPYANDKFRLAIMPRRSYSMFTFEVSSLTLASSSANVPLLTCRGLELLGLTFG